MIDYIIKMILCASLLYIFYVLFFEKENMNRFKRMYLLFALVFSLTIPLIVFNISIYKPVNDIETMPANFEETKDKYMILTIGEYIPEVNNNIIESTVNYHIVVCFLYLSVSFLLLLRLLRNIYYAFSCIKNYDCINYYNYKIVLVNKNIAPHSFFRYIFINKKDFEKGRVANEILFHESEHIRQKHSLDIIFIELLIVFFWFNPIFYLYRRKIKLNHEFLADESVIKKCTNIAYYQNLLLNTIKQKRDIVLCSNFNYQEIKRRFIMMSKITSRTMAFLKILILIPMIVLSVCFFSKKLAAQDYEPIKDRQVNAIKAGEINSKNLPEYIIPKQGVSQKQIAEFSTLLSRYIESDTGSKIEWKSYDLTDDEIRRLYVIYVQMTEEQRNKQCVMISGPLTPLLLRSPTKSGWKKYKNFDSIFIDGKEVDKRELGNISRKSIVLHAYKGRKDIYLWTKKGYEEYLNRYEKMISVSKLLETDPMVWFRMSRKSI